MISFQWEIKMYLGLDLGTSGLRGLLVQEDGKIIGSAEATYDVHHPHAGWSEQTPADWTTACDTVIAALRTAHPTAFAALKGLGVAGHMHGATLLDSTGQVLRPCMLWNDSRAIPRQQNWMPRRGFAKFQATSCSQALPLQKCCGWPNMSQTFLLKLPRFCCQKII